MIHTKRVLDSRAGDPTAILAYALLRLPEIGSLALPPSALLASLTVLAGLPRAELDAMLQRYDPARLQDGWNQLPDGQRIFFIRNPALGLWASRARMG